jgi:hypothetical protein
MEQKHDQAKEGAKYASEKYEKWAVRPQPQSQPSDLIHIIHDHNSDASVRTSPACRIRLSGSQPGRHPICSLPDPRRALAGGGDGDRDALQQVSFLPPTTMNVGHARPSCQRRNQGRERAAPASRPLLIRAAAARLSAELEAAKISGDQARALPPPRSPSAGRALQPVTSSLADAGPRRSAHPWALGTVRCRVL